jgi:hypothetical protein
LGARRTLRDRHTAWFRSSLTDFVEKVFSCDA